ncbi:TIR domain-containing protein [Bradyrhizobium diazoefficiens]|uniref:TIR domain-containing protein n=1 Tax=Bradyrhizobium diazoefficiens TaxID=1355477 RepID=UPI0004B75CDC|nr:nucleotide-binding protein [Bradyrhizobium diazoefficiens]
MPKIDQRLIARLSDKLGIGDKAVYARIAKVANEMMLDRHLAALVLAGRHHINTNKYSTPEERAEIRGAQRMRHGGIEGEPPPEMEMMERPARRRPASKAKKRARRMKANTVFVVHGRDEPLRRSMFEFLRALGLAPQEWQQALAAAKGTNLYVGAVLDEVMEQAQAVVVMLSPDDLVQLKEQFVGRDEKNSKGKPQGQARPNVLFEAGMAMAAHSKKTVMVRIGKIKPFSDVFGRHIPSLGDDFDSRNDLANRLQKAGCTVNKVGTDWTRAGNFVPTEHKTAKKRSRNA